MANVTITKEKPDYFGPYSQENLYESSTIECNSTMSYARFIYQTAMTSIDSLTLKFRIKGKKASSGTSDIKVRLYFYGYSNDYSGGYNYYYSKTLTSSFSGETTFTINGLNGYRSDYNSNGPFVVTASAVDGCVFDIEATQATFTGPQPTLSITPSESVIYVNNKLTFTFNNRMGVDLLVHFESSLPWENLVKRVKENTYSWTFKLGDFESKAFNERYVEFVAEDTCNRRASVYITVKREPLTVSVKYSTLSVNDKTQVVTISDPYKLPLNIMTVATDGMVKLNEKTNFTGTTFSFELTESAFVKARSYSDTLPIQVRAYDDYRESWANFNLVRTALTVQCFPVTPESGDVYIRTGNYLALQFSGRLGRELEIEFYNGVKKLKTISGYDGYVQNTDRADYEMLKRWFDDALDTTNTTLAVTYCAYDKAYYRRVQGTFTLSAGQDMYPVVTQTSSTYQPTKTPRGTDWPSKLANYFVQGYSKAKFEVTVTLPTNAGVKSVYLKSSKLGTVQLTKNNTTGKYEKVTTSALTADVPYTIVVTDQRGLTTTTPEQTITVLEYRLPNITNVTYYRVDSSGQKTDDGDHCLIKASYFYSPLYKPNTEEALNEKYATCVFGGTDIYRDYVPGYWRPTGTIITRTTAANIERSYNIDFYAYDLLNSIHLSYILSTAGVIMDFLSGGKGIGLGKVAETSKMVEVNPEWKLQAKQINVYVNGQYVDLSTILQQLLNS